MSRDNDTKKAVSETSFILAVTFTVEIQQKAVPALVRGDLSQDVAVPSSLTGWLVFSPPDTTSVLAQPLTAVLSLLQLLQMESGDEPTVQTIAHWSRR